MKLSILYAPRNFNACSFAVFKKNMYAYNLVDKKDEMNQLLIKDYFKKIFRQGK